MYIPNQEIVGSATYSEMLEAMDILATDDEKRKEAEQEMTNDLPKGFSVGIDIFGLAHILSPLQVHKLI
jgi:hypothetical protein